MEYALKLMCEEKRIPTIHSTEKLSVLEGPFSVLQPDEWCSPCFPQPKPGRTFPGTELDLVRLLCDECGVNSCCKMTFYELWKIYNPTRESLIRQQENSVAMGWPGWDHGMAS